MATEQDTQGSGERRFPHLLPEEALAVEHRRQAVYQDGSGPNATWGLALSGGGIRSATFCLGVLQALSKAAFRISGEPSAPSALAATFPLLARFDFLSTVSGGGYVGGFFSALFRPRGQSKDNPASTQEERAKATYAALASDPPGRMNGAASAVLPQEPSAQPVDQPLRWLRENGRYLAPNSTGDLVYDLAIAIRNLCAVHYVVGISLLTLFLLMFAFRHLTVQQHWGASIELLMQPGLSSKLGAMWWSPWFVMAGLWMALRLVPLGVAYWLYQSSPNAKMDKFGAPIIAAFCLLVAGTCLLWSMTQGFSALPHSFKDNPLVFCLASFLTILVIALLYAIYFNWQQKSNTRLFRSTVTRRLSTALSISIGLLTVSLVESLGQSLYLWLQHLQSSPHGMVSLVGVIATAVTVLRKLSPMLAQPSKVGRLVKLPLNAILIVVGLLLLLALLVAWHCIATAVFFGFKPVVAPFKDDVFIATNALNFGLIAFCVAATMVGGYFIGFINLSSLQVMYSNRLTRAYLGASNKNRFVQDATKKDVTEPHADDDLNRAAYFENNHLGPAHIINVTINATTGSGDQLTQRDRQGIPMAVTPAGVTVEGKPWVTEGAEELTIGQWIGISGAAFATGIGRGTSLGTAIAFSLTNIRLGWWWNSGKKYSKYIFPIWRNQAYLMREMRAYFPGTDGSHWYLSDGGHYENTAVLELLRRRLNFVVCCDCGADPHYEFEDLANLMRLARIDLGAEFESIAPAQVPFFAARSAELARYFADAASELCSAQSQTIGGGNKCALLYKVSYPPSAVGTDTNGDTAYSILLLIKPRLIDQAPLDLHQYQSQHAEFPQQSTGDQFFDEAQWESYRKLGVVMGDRIFGA